MRKVTFLFAMAVALLASCTDHESGESVSTPDISGYIAEVNSYGQLIPDFTPNDMKEKGFEYADLIHVKIGDDIDIDSVPFLTSFNEIGCFDMTYVDYNAQNTDYGFGLFNADFHQLIGGEKGDKITITLTQKGGYKEKYELLKSTYPVERRAGETAEEYANFRMVTTTGIGTGTLYRSSNPLNCAKNAGRYRVVDSLACVAGIKTEIDLADTQADIKKYMATADYASTYCPQLFNEGNTMACGLSADIFGDVFKAKMGEVVRFMIAHQPPYLIHCNEGKDRCGFVALLFEAFMGADISELNDDYMKTLINFYQIEAGSESYQLRKKLSIDRMIWVMCHEKTLCSLPVFDWDKIDVSVFGQKDLQRGAENYLKECGVSDSECAQLRAILSTAVR